MRRLHHHARRAFGAAKHVGRISVGELVVERGLRAAAELSEACSVREGVGALVEQRASSALVKNVASGEISGILTARDLLRWLHERPDAPDAPLTEVATPEAKVAWCAPEDSLERAQSVSRAARDLHDAASSRRAWMFRGDESRRRRGRDVDYSVETRRGAAAAAAWIVRGDDERARACSRGEVNG